VQGEGAAAEIARAIRTANDRAEVDVLIVGRGGGSIEDLWAFNEEVVARAVFESALPVVSGVGHETDFTICDFVADLRAATPTAAAAAATADRHAIALHLAQRARSLARAADHVLGDKFQQVDRLARRLVHPAARLAVQRERTHDLARRLRLAMRMDASIQSNSVRSLQARFMRELRAPLPAAARAANAGVQLRRVAQERLAHLRHRTAAIAASLGHLSPLAVLTRGYSIVTRADGTVVTSAAQLVAGTQVDLRFQRGSAIANVTRTTSGDDADL
jgi:exodeoxyribonuclease VII large subunit